MKRDIFEHTRERSVPFSKGDVFILYSDGIIEAGSCVGKSCKIYGIDRLQSVVSGAQEKTPQGIFSHVSHDVSLFLGLA